MHRKINNTVYREIVYAECTDAFFKSSIGKCLQLHDTWGDVEFFLSQIAPHNETNFGDAKLKISLPLNIWGLERATALQIDITVTLDQILVNEVFTVRE